MKPSECLRRRLSNRCFLALLMCVVTVLVSNGWAFAQTPAQVGGTDDISKQRPPPPPPPVSQSKPAGMATPQTTQIRSSVNQGVGDMTMGLQQIRQQILTDMDQIDAANATIAAREADVAAVRACMTSSAEIGAFRACVGAAVPALANVPAPAAAPAPAPGKKP
jgi:hypothetical protein